MKFLVDSCVVAWLANEPTRVPVGILNILEDLENAIFLSSVSIWELVRKIQNGRLSFEQPPEVFFPSLKEVYGLEPMPFTQEAALMLMRLPDIHRDPFDRMLICQALVEGCALVTPDPAIRQYPVHTVW